jgi:hypothetical protein
VITSDLRGTQSCPGSISCNGSYALKATRFSAYEILTLLWNITQYSVGHCLYGRGSIPARRQQTFLFCTGSEPALGLTQSPFRLGPRRWGVRGMRLTIHLHPVQRCKHRGNFNFIYHISCSVLELVNVIWKWWTGIDPQPTDLHATDRVTFIFRLVC